MRWFERNRAACGSPGLFTEEYDVDQRQLRGNYPQSLVHALLIESARRLAEPGRLGQVGDDDTADRLDNGTTTTKESHMTQHAQQQVVVVTGASGGIGRATAIAFGATGAAVALLARGESGLQAAAEEVEVAGGRALVVPVDVADADAVERAAATVEEQLGPIDVWVNVASLLGVRAVLGDRSEGVRPGDGGELPRLRVRDDGRPVPDAPAGPWGDRPGGLRAGLPGHPAADRLLRLQHAIQGFHEALRCELLHERSGVHVTMVQMPAVNTPQFSWLLSRLPRQAQPVPPIYQPEVAARAVLYAATTPGDGSTGSVGSTIGTLVANAVAPGLLDRYLARTGFSSQQTDQPQTPTSRPTSGSRWTGTVTSAPTGASTTGRRRAACSCGPPSTTGLLAVLAGGAAAGTAAVARAVRR